MSKPSTPSATSNSNLILKRQLIELQKHPVEGFSAGILLIAHSCDRDPAILLVSSGLVDDDNLLEWEVMLIG